MWPGLQVDLRRRQPQLEQDGSTIEPKGWKILEHPAEYASGLLALFQ